MSRDLRCITDGMHEYQKQVFGDLKKENESLEKVNKELNLKIKKLEEKLDIAWDNITHQP